MANNVLAGHVEVTFANFGGYAGTVSQGQRLFPYCRYELGDQGCAGLHDGCGQSSLGGRPNLEGIKRRNISDEAWCAETGAPIGLPQRTEVIRSTSADER